MQPGPFTQADFNQQYWFSSLQMVTVVNPKDSDFEFMVEGRHFMVRAGATERLPGVIANVYLDMMTKIIAQDDKNLSYMSDPQLMRVYYDKIIVDKEDMIQEHANVPAYMRNIPTTATEPSVDTPPWEAPVEQPAAPVVPEPPKEVKPETKEFTYEDSTYKLTVDKNGKELYFQNGKRITPEVYFKAASM